MSIDEQLQIFLGGVFPPCCGPGSSVGIATGYGLDGLGSNPGRDEIFRPSRPALGLTQPPVGTGYFPGVKCGRGVLLSTHSPAVMEEYSYTSTHPVGHTGPVTGSLYLSSTLEVRSVRQNVTSPSVTNAMSLTSHINTVLLQCAIKIAVLDGLLIPS